MAVIYSDEAITARLNGLVSAIGSAAVMRLLDTDGDILASITLGSPFGAVENNIITVTGNRTATAIADGTISSAEVTDSSGRQFFTDLTVGIPLSGEEVIVSNGLNSLVVETGQTITLLSGQITETQ